MKSKPSQPSALLLYQSHDGQTEKIMRYIADILSQDMICTIQDIETFPDKELENYDTVLIGAALRYGHFNKKVLQFVNRHRDYLSSIPCAFFGVCLIARKAHKRTLETNVYLRTFFKKTSWQPPLIVSIAGALLYPRYTWFDRLMIKLIMTITGGETDTSKEIEFTDWEQVQEFASAFKHEVFKNFSENK